MTEENPAQDDSQKVYHRFCHTLGSAKYLFADGTEAIFIQGEYFTDDKKKIAALKAEVAAKNVHIYIDKAKKTVVAEDRDPMVALKKRLRAQILEEEGLVPRPANSSTEPTKVQPQVTKPEKGNAPKIVNPKQ